MRISDWSSDVCSSDLDGASVVLTDVLDELGADVAQSLGERAIYRNLDVRNALQLVEVIELAERRFGPPDVLVNNAGIMPFMPVAQLPIEDYRLVMDVNLLGSVLGLQTVIPRLLQRGFGSIVILSSVIGRSASPAWGAYPA